MLITDSDYGSPIVAGIGLLSTLRTDDAAIDDRVDCLLPGHDVRHAAHLFHIAGTTWRTAC